MKETINLASDHVSIIRGKLMEYFPLLMKYVSVTVDAARATQPYLKNIGVYCVGKKQHAYLFGFIVLLVLFNCCTSGGSAGNSRKMMKAPGRNYRMPRDDFEKSPRSGVNSRILC
ncbi:hypothetical protein FRX31_034524 [Thalictrum thalictroides]|uniref:Uncharacterized protein n=1 Tax=Thalictrum thalictroides TaxID=46969 RepID=A0A7J6UTJ0_THATH|nr:hypothetical protein FRX31_034524 [Thalictrum thalictroides]